MVKNYRPASAGMLAALPGTYLIHAYFESGDVELVRCNVIGWQISTERTLTPLVVDPRAAEEDVWFVLHTDGRVECNDGRCWDSLDEWVSDERRAHEAENLVKISDLVAPRQSGTVPFNGSPPSTPYAA
jgi:hypothetical protein